MTILKKIILSIVIIFAIIYAYASCATGNDFEVYLEAAKQLKNHNNIYAPPFIRGLQYFYSVFFALLLLPVSNYVFITQFLWILVTYVFLFRIGVLISSYFDLSILTQTQKNILLFFAFFLSIQFILYEVDLIQITSFLLWSMLESIGLLRKKKYIAAGVILAVAINIKIMPLLLFPYLFYRGYFKTIFVCFGCFVILLFLPSIFIGTSYNHFLLAEWWRVINPTNKEHLFETEIGPHSLTAWLPVLLMDSVGEFPEKRNFLNLMPSTVEIILNVTRFLLLSLSLFYLRTLPFKKENNDVKFFWELAYFIMLIPLIMPHQQKYNFLLVTPMLTYLLYFFISTIKFKKTFFYKIVFVLFILNMLVFSPIYGSDIIGKWYRYTQHFRVLTICTLLVIPISIYCNPARLNDLCKRGYDDVGENKRLQEKLTP